MEKTGRVFRALLSVFLAFLCAAQCAVCGATVLPDYDSVFGVEMPSLRHTALKDPVSEETLADGGKRLVFDGITKENYADFSRYLFDWECELADYSVEGTVMTATVKREGAFFTFAYDCKTLLATVTYPAVTREEAVDVEILRRERYEAFCQPGSIVAFGRYPQTAEGRDSTPIEWQVLEYDAENGKALLISRYGLDMMPYNTKREPVTWENSDLRAWLNGEFFGKAFTPEEQSAILPTEVDNSASQNYGDWTANGGNNTQDRIFLLSYAEANRFFGVGKAGNMESRAAPTEYTVEKGVYTAPDHKTEDGAAAGSWWLRSPGYGQSRAAYVDVSGSLNEDYVSDVSICVRPAFWLSLDSVIF